MLYTMSAIRQLTPKLLVLVFARVASTAEPWFETDWIKLAHNIHYLTLFIDER
jgi:hypothetical protein